MTLVVPRRASLPRLSFRDWLRRELSPVLAWLADTAGAYSRRRLALAPVPLPVTTVRDRVIEQVRVEGCPWGTAAVPGDRKAEA